MIADKKCKFILPPCTQMPHRIPVGKRQGRWKQPSMRAAVPRAGEPTPAHPEARQTRVELAGLIRVGKI